MYKLVVQRGAREKREIVLKPDRTTLVGRRRACHICIPAADVSREHCALVYENGKLIVRDLASSNGTWVNGQQVKEAELHPGDTLGVGPVLFVVQLVSGGPGDTAKPGEQPALAVDQGGPQISYTAPPHPAEAPTEKIPPAGEEADFEILEAELAEDVVDAEVVDAEPVGDDEVTQFFIDMDEQKQ